MGLMFTHGKDAKVLVDQFDMSADLTQYNFGLSTQTVDVTTFSNADRVYLPGLNEGSISVQGVFNNATDRTDEELSALRGAETVISASRRSRSLRLATGLTWSTDS
jgi:hypothetical protein